MTKTREALIRLLKVTQSLAEYVAGKPERFGGSGSGHWGHAGRPGEVGGSAPGDGGTVSGGASSGDRRQGHPPAAAGNGETQFGSLYDRVVGQGSVNDAPARGRAKQTVARGLATTTGYREAIIGDFVANWAETSNDNDLRALTIQETAGRVFGVGVSDWQQKSLVRLGYEREDRISENPEGDLGELATAEEAYFGTPEGDGVETTLQAMYSRTQRQLADAEIAELTVFRGASFPSDSPMGRAIIQTLEETGGRQSSAGHGLDVSEHHLEMPLEDSNALESWSTDRGIATAFMGEPEPGRVSVVLTMQIPAERVFSTPMSGFGCLEEREVIILGQRADDPPDISLLSEITFTVSESKGEEE